MTPGYSQHNIGFHDSPRTGYRHRPPAPDPTVANNRNELAKPAYKPPTLSEPGEIYEGTDIPMPKERAPPPPVGKIALRKSGRASHLLHPLIDRLLLLMNVKASMKTPKLVSHIPFKIKA